MFPKKLLDGYKDFLNSKFQYEQIRYKSLAVHGQKPEYMIISCCDSRVSPEAIFNASPGEMFIVRNVASLVPPYDEDHSSSYHGTSAAIEFAVTVLNVKNIIILGHASCGGINFLLQNQNHNNGFINKWMSQVGNLAIGISNESKDDIKKLELSIIEYSINNLLSFPYIKTRSENHELNINGAYFRIHDGSLLIRESNQNSNIFTYKNIF